MTAVSKRARKPDVGLLREQTRQAATETQAQSRLRPSRFANVFDGKVTDLDVEMARYIRLETGIAAGHVPAREQARADAACAAALKLWNALAAQVEAGDTSAEGKAMLAKIREDLGW